MANFSDILDVKAKDVEPPAVLPVGLYLVELTKVPTFKDSGSGEWTMINYPFKVVEAEDVDEDDLADFGSPKGEGGQYTFMAPTSDDTEGERRRQLTLNQIKKFHVDVLGQDEDLTIKQMQAECVKSQMLLMASHEEYQGEPQVRWAKPMAAD